MTGLTFLVLLLAAIPVLITMMNLPFYRRLPPSASRRHAVSVLIPARDEEANIAETQGIGRCGGKQQGQQK